MPTERPPEIRGARDLAALWRALPAAVLAYPVTAYPPHVGLAALSDTLRARAWREHCAATTLESCAEQGRDCARLGRCRADALFPMKLGGGAPSWRMATFFVRWRPALEQLHLIALGAAACDSIGWAARCLRERHSLEGAVPLAVATLADLELTNATRWELTFVTPWLVGKGRPDADAPPDVETLAHELRKAMRLRAHKLTPLCLNDERVQRLSAHLAHHVAEALLSGGLSVESAEIEPEPLTLASRGNGASFTALTWSGRAILRVKPAVLPWLSLIALGGGGENADKGFGAIELTPLD
ncbi:hypothetical protein ThidrDRAFT_1147 [Thiorhodococcus drewsii AZ1]|uniref:CRISPR-associated protein Cas6 C-terminal domain-containing protein n=1 Tax=Thiorhodococcus drewsii AZ1 TaxID=765913 RepID=G2DYN5_9GAMM|nr:hypothetical protein [Thiorhodococcus drewsii]EGV32662.1 hypothetical protein ThidrDRAFT_1147 [Thiorhodococcus drewsii AZ1]